MNLLNFVSRFPYEASCKSAFKDYRDRQGVVCPKCGQKDHLVTELLLKYFMHL